MTKQPKQVSVLSKQETPATIDDEAETEGQRRPTFLKCNDFMERLLCKAATDGTMYKMVRIMQERIDPNCVDGCGYTPLHYAAESGQYEVLKLLINNGAKVNAANASGVTPLHLAAKYDQIKCAQVLMLAGADVQAACLSGVTPLHLTPDSSETRSMLEQCILHGIMLNPREVFDLSEERIVPSWSIPPLTKEQQQMLKERENSKKK